MGEGEPAELSTPAIDLSLIHPMGEGELAELSTKAAIDSLFIW